MRSPGISRWFRIFFFLRIGQGCIVSVGGEIYDLSALQNAGKDGIVTVTPPESEQGEYKYQASFCEDLVTCQTTKGNLARLRASNLNSCIGSYGNWATGVNTKTASGFDADFQSTEYCADDFSQYYSSTFKFLCDESAGTLGTIQAEKDGTNACKYSVSIYTNLVCGGSTPVPGPTQAPAHAGGSTSGGGLSWGSIFLITLVVALFMYITLGVGLNYKKEQSYKTPHMDFWCSRLPYWTKIGCITSWIWTLWCCQVSYSWCCIHICKRQNSEETTPLRDGDDSS